MPPTSRKVTLKLSQLADAQPALDALTSARLPGPLVLRLRRLLRVVEPEVKDYNEQRVVLAKQYGDTKDGQHFTFPDPEKRNLFDEAVKAMGEETVTLDVPDIQFEGVIADRELLSAAELDALSWLFTDLADEEEPTTDAAAQSPQD